MSEETGVVIQNRGVNTNEQEYHVDLIDNRNKSSKGCGYREFIQIAAKANLFGKTMSNFLLELDSHYEHYTKLGVSGSHGVYCTSETCVCGPVSGETNE